MLNKTDFSPRVVAELIFRLGRVAHDYVEGLSPAQWSVLRYLSRANKYSRTVSGFAEFHATTRGTASQTVKSLVALGYVSKTKSPKDGRSAVLDLTRSGRALVAKDPYSALVNAVAELPTGLRAQTMKGLTRIRAALEERETVRTFGTCTDCAFFQPREPSETSESDSPEYLCTKRNEALQLPELEQLCVNHQPGKRKTR